MNYTKYWIGFGDVHNYILQPGDIPELKDAAGVVISGDLTNHGGAEEARAILSPIASVNPNIYAQLGNMDTAGVTKWLEQEGYNIHRTAKSLSDDDSIGIMGVGASTPTPFGTPSEFSDAQIAAWLEEAYKEAARFKALLLVAHDPPQGTMADRLSSGQHVGSQAVRDFLERIRPEVCLTGHIHESQAVDTLGSTTVINPGMLSSGGYVIIHEQESGLSAELKSFK